jgi:hypothetical protein
MTILDEVGFKIERKLGASGSYSEVAILPANAETFTDPYLLSNTTYYYRVRTYNLFGNSDYSNEVSGTTGSDSGGGVPTAPTGLTVAPVDSLRMRRTGWTPPALSRAKVEPVATSTTFTEIASLGANVVSYTDIGLLPNTAYVYRVRAWGTSGYSDYCSPVSGTTFPPVPPIPYGVIASALDSQRIKLNWTDASGYETGFKIERKSSATGSFAQVAIVGANVTSFTDTALLANTTYHIIVTGFVRHSGYHPSERHHAPSPPTAPSA